MQLGVAVQKIFEAYKKAKSGDPWGAALLFLEVVQAIFISFPPNVARPVFASSANYSAMSDDELLEIINQELTPKMNAVEALTGPPQGPIIDKLLPIMWILIQRWLKIV